MESKRKLLTKINDFCLFVENFELCVDFYMNTLGFDLKRQQEGYVEFEFHGTSITLWDINGVYTAIPREHLNNGHRFMVAILVPELSDVDDLYHELTARGVNFISLPVTYPWEARAAYFTDPEGNIWEIFAWAGEKVPGLVKPD
jgi:catechol 2,3-dioxygenase-like lactoylglutathione lyase family enzyme